MATTDNPYLQEALRKQQLAYDEAKRAAAERYATQRQQAQETAQSARGVATSDYQRQINPYGVQAEALAQAGLRNSGVSQTAQSKAYGSYMNRLGQVQVGYGQAEREIAANEAQNLSNLDIQRLNAEANYQNMLYEDAWKNKQFDYQKGRDDIGDQRYSQQWDYQVGRDAIADRRYDQEWAYQQRKGSAGGGGGRSSSGRSYSSGGDGGGGGVFGGFTDGAPINVDTSNMDINTAYSRSKNRLLHKRREHA